VLVVDYSKSSTLFYLSKIKKITYHLVICTVCKS
jgi:hypothetical protein